MNWIQLWPKEPDFNERVLFMNKKKEWFEGRLSEVLTTSEGKKYKVSYWDGNKESWTDEVTHFMRITSPKE